MLSENRISRRGLFMKLGIIFNGLVATALAIPIVRFLLSSVTRGRAGAYLSWVPLVRRQLRAPGLPGPLVSAIRSVHVPLSWRSLLPRWLTRVRSPRTGTFSISAQN